MNFSIVAQYRFVGTANILAIEINRKFGLKFQQHMFIEVTHFHL